MDEIDRFLQRLQKLTTATYFPAIYEGFVEADALIQSEDSLLGLMRDYAQQLWQNRNLLSMTEEKVALFEEMLHLTPNVSQSLDDRRQAVADAVNERFVLNDAKLHEICQALAPGFTAYERTDPQALTLGIFTEEDAEDGTLPAVGIVDGIRPTVPQNLALYAGVDTAFDRPLVVSHAHFCALWAGLGTVERHVPNVVIRGGQIGEESATVYTSEKWPPNTVGALSMGAGIMADGIAQDGGTFRLHPDYTPVYPAYEFPQYDGTETTGQLAGGTLRLFGTNANQEVETTATPGMPLGELQLGVGGLITGALQMGGVIEADSNT
ncbi:MAG: hypothetical protein IJU23_12000 [Proteobacteria bacterium]|nr:hypothetical protein [Pseudomonadota bacterium]